MAKPILYVGNYNYSSWSLRAHLVMRWSGIAFDERYIPLRQPGYGTRQIAEVCAVSPGGTVPVLHVVTGDGAVVRIGDSLAIAEWAAESAPTAHLWPEDEGRRATARAVTCEMHSGFAALRRDLPMNLARRTPARPWPDDTRRDIARALEILTDLRARHRDLGPWLFGPRTIADAFFAPIVARFRSYGVVLPPSIATYSETVFSDAAFRAWEAAGIPESWDHPDYPTIDGLYRERHPAPVSPNGSAPRDGATHRNRAAYAEFAAGWAARDLERMMRCLTHDVVYAASIGPEPGTTYRGADEVRAGIARMIEYDDAVAIATDVLDVDEDRVVVQWSYTVRNGEGGTRIIRGIDLIEFRDGKIAAKDAFRKSLA